MTSVTPPPLMIKTLEDRDGPAWDAFVRATPSASFFHLSGWRTAIRKAFGHDCHFLMACNGAGEIRGVLPLVHSRGRLFGNRLISTAFCVEGGIAALDDAAAAALEAQAIALAERLRVDCLELRGGPTRMDGWIRRAHQYASFRRTIGADAEANLKAIPRKQRAVVRKAIGLGLTVETVPDVHRLHRLYAESVRNLGTPVFPRRWFTALVEEFRDECEIVTVLDGGQPLSAVLNFFFRDTVLPYYGGGVAAARGGANDLMYWDTLRRAGERGLSAFDFGRSKVGTGAFDFKKNWGFEPEPLSYAVRPGRPGATIPEINPLNPRYRLFVDTWKRLPLNVSMWLGPLIARELG